MGRWGGFACLRCCAAGLLLAAPAQRGDGAGAARGDREGRGAARAQHGASARGHDARRRRAAARRRARARARARAAQRRRLGRRAAPARRAAAGAEPRRGRAARARGSGRGLYVPSSGRLYVLGAGGSAPRSVVAHEVVHALQDEHFQLTRGPFASRPRDHDGELAATALVEGDATEVQSRYVASLSPLDLLGELGAHARRRPEGASAARRPVPAAPARVPVHGGTGVRARPARARRAAAARPRVPAPAAHDRRGARPGALPGRRPAAAGRAPARRELPLRDARSGPRIWSR